MKLNPESIARSSARHPWRTLGVWVVVLVSMGVVSSTLLAGVLSQDIAFTNKPESVKAQDVIDKQFSAGGSKDTEFFIVSSKTQTASDPVFRTFVETLKGKIEKLGPADVSGPVVTYVEATAQAQSLFTSDGHGVMIALRLSGDPAAAIPTVQQAATSAAPAGFEVQVVTAEQLAQSSGGSSSTSPPAAGAPNAFAVVSSQTTATSDPSFATSVSEIQTAIQKGARAVIAAPPLSAFDAQKQAAGLISQDGTTALIPVQIPDIKDSIVEDLRGVASGVSTGTFSVQVAGRATLSADFTKIAEEDLQKGERIGLLSALVVLIVVFAAVVAAVLPLVMGLFAIAVALGLVALIGQLVHFNLFVENMVSMIGLAVGIDYSLFIVSRYREERKKGFEKLEAIGAAGATANRAVFFSGMTVVLALLGMFLIPVSIFRSMAGGAMLVTLAAIAGSMTLLPALLSLLGDRINWPRLSKRARMDSDHDPKGGFWDRVTRSVMARPVVYLLASVLVLGTLGSFYFQLHRGTSQSVSNLPGDFQSKQAFLVLQQQFNAGGVTDPAEVVITGDVTSPEAQAAVRQLQGAIAQLPAFSGQTTVDESADGTAVRVSAYFRGDPSSDPAFQAIRDLRSTTVPGVFGGVPGVQVYVGGNSAFFTDFMAVADQYQLIVLAFVLGLSFILLTVVFRSIVLPIKAILMNLLSVGAAYGAVTLVFQKGVGIGIFNAIGFQFQRVDAIEAWLPLFLFSILFGLSMDYHVFLLARIREEYDKTGDNAEAVAYGLRTTAGIITGAALIMVAVFTAFAAGRIGALQQMGFGLAVAVFMDATIVRSILVPAGMRLLGDLNWYLPKWLKWLPQLHVEGHEPTMSEVVAVPEPVGSPE